MTISNYFTPIKDSSITFNGTSFDLGHTVASSDSRSIVSPQINDLTLQALGGEMVLVLGNPTSALFESLFSADRKLHYTPQGSLRFKNHEFKEFGTRFPHQVVYNNEQDVHFPHLTVEQTIDFALSCKFDLPKSERVHIRNELLQKFGLSHVLKTIVGNDYVRGCSGGERKRISIIETFIANGSLYLWDNSTKGLDSSTALEFLSMLRIIARETKSINFVRISQASDKIVETFDKILILGDSKQLFFGTLEDCFEFFHGVLGIEKNPDDCIIEYLTSILNLQFETTGPSEGEKHEAPIYKSQDDLYNCWVNSSYYKHWKQITSDAIEAAKMTDSSLQSEDVIPPIRSISLVKEIMTVTRRDFQRSLGDTMYLLSQLMSIIVQALVIGSLFYNVPLTTIGSFSRGSLTFFSILFFTFLALAEMPSTFQRQPVVNKQAKLHFYRLWIETLGSTVFDYAYKFFLVVIFTILLYFLAHLQYSASRFFIFLLFISIYNFCMVSLFSLTALMTPTLAVANLVAGLLLLSIAMYASYVIYFKNMHPWFIWIAYLNPAMFAMESMLSNELFNINLSCSESVVPRGPAYDDVPFIRKACAWQGATLGNDFVRGKDYLKEALSYSYNYVWRNFGILIGFLCFYLFSSFFAAQYVKPLYEEGEFHRYLKKYAPFLANLTESQITPQKPTLAITPTGSSSTNFTAGDSPSVVKYSDDISHSESAECNTGHDGPQKHLFSWKNMNYTVAGDKQLINNASGFISSGLTALMGESGAGKTTLLNILSQRVETGVVTGELLVDGKLITNIEAFKRSIGFVQQQDIHLEHLTVGESLEISCILRGDGDISYVATLSNLLKLPLDTLVLNLTPTQRKLLSIGVELVTKPSLLLFLDEPTSGLDAESALTIVRFLKKLSDRGQAILCTIHQPSRSVISYFDNIYLLKRGGECVYFGSTQGACDYFMKYDPTLVFDRETGNPADFVIDVVGNNEGTQEVQLVEQKAISKFRWADVWTTSVERAAIEETMAKLEREAVDSGADFTKNVRTPPGYWQQLMVIIRRQYTAITRDRSYIISKFALNGCAGLFIGFSFWQVSHGINGLQDTIFFNFMSLCLSSPLINQVQDKALAAKEVYLARESRSNTFHWSILMLSQLVVELPFAISSSTLFFLCAYFCCKFSDSPHIGGVWYFNYILFSVYYLTFGLWLIYASPNLQTAAVFVAFFYSFTASFCGVMQPYSLFPGFWRFMYRVSPYTYFIDTFTSVLLHDRKVKCTQGELVPGQPSLGMTCGEYFKPYIEEHGGYLQNANAIGVCGYCSYAVGDQFLQVQKMSYSHRWRNFGIEWAYVGFNTAGMFVGYYLTYIAEVWSIIVKVVMKYIPGRTRALRTKEGP